MKKLYNMIVQRVLLLVIVAVLMISGISVWMLQIRILPNLSTLAKNNVESKVSDIQLWFDFNVEVLKQYASAFSDIEITADNQEILLERLQRFKKQSHINYESLGFITLDGEKFITDRTIFTVVQRDYFQELQYGDCDAVISNVIESKANHKQIVLVVAKVYDQNEKVKGYISAALTTQYLKKIVNNLGASSFNAFIKDQNDEVIIGTKYGQKNHLHFEKQILNQPKWTFVLEVPQDYINKEIINTIILLVVTTCFVVLATIFIVRRFANTIVEPTEKLERMMGNVKTGILEHIENTSRIKEFVSLNHSYNAMVKELHKLLEEVKRQERLKNEANNKAMFSQIKPHFLYNTLETIQAMAFEHNDIEVEEAINNLAVLFRIGLSDDRQIIRLEEEIAHVKSYLYIQMLRYHDILSYELQNDGVDSKLPFMKFVIQPLVENAIYHGVKLLDHPSIIKIHIYQVNQSIVVDVINEYASIDKKRIQSVNEALAKNEIPQDQRGYGLFNVNTRLKMNFSNIYGIGLYYDDLYITGRLQHPILAEGGRKDEFIDC